MIEGLKSEIDSKSILKTDLIRQLELLKEERDELLFSLKEELEGDDQDSIDLLYNKHMLNLK